MYLNYKCWKKILEMQLEYFLLSFTECILQNFPYSVHMYSKLYPMIYHFLCAAKADMVRIKRNIRYSTSLHDIHNSTSNVKFLKKGQAQTQLVRNPGEFRTIFYIFVTFPYNSEAAVYRRIISSASQLHFQYRILTSEKCEIQHSGDVLILSLVLTRNVSFSPFIT